MSHDSQRTRMPSRGAKKCKSDGKQLKADEEGPSEDNKIVIKSDARRRVKGRLSRLLELPMDILFEIFGHLKPFDLLRLARVTKEFRKLLMRKSSKSVWKAALDGIPGLPPCPAEMTEPAWASLAFDPHCHFCIKATVRAVEWTWRVRICNKCAKEKVTETIWFFPDDDCVSTFKDRMDRFPVQCLLLSRPGKRRDNVLTADLEEMRVKYATFTDDESRLSFIKERRKVISDIKAHAELCMEWVQSQAEDRSSELQDLRDERRTAIIKKLVALGYEADIASIRQPHSLENQEHVRKPQKLTERIWANIREPVIKFMDEMRAIRLNREHKQLILLRKPAAVSVFRAYMAKHHPFTDLIPSGLDFCAFPLVKEILEQSSEVEVDESSFTDVVPLIPDFITDWRQSLDGHIIQVIKDDPSFLFRHSLWNKFGEFVGKLDKDSYKDDWSLEDHGIHNWAEATLRRRKLLFNESKLPLKLPLATTVFTCKKCNKAAPNETDIAYETDDDDNFAGYSPGSLGSGTYSKPLFYPEVKGHHCLTRKKVFDLPLWLQGHEEYGELLMENPARKLDSNKVWRRRWSTHPLRINRRLEDCARALVKEAGLDPETTTVQDMDNLDTWFACLVCADNCGEEVKKDVDVRPYEMPAFKWRLAMEHFASGHPHSWTQPAWTAIGLDQFDDAVETFKCNPRSSHNKPEGSNNGPRRIVLPVTKDTTWSCVHCRDTPAELPPTSFESITQHLNEKHNLKELEENKDYYKDFAAVSPLPPQQQVIISFSCKEVKKATAFAMSMAFGLSDFGGFFDFDSEPDSDLDEWDGPGFAAGTFMF